MIRDTDLVVKHNNLVTSRYKLDWSEQRIILFLISKIEKEDEDFKEYPISIISMARLIGLTDNDKSLGGGVYSRAEQTINALMTRVLTVKEGKDWRKFHWVSSAKYLHKQGHIILKISPELKPYLLQLKGSFTTYELGNVIKMKSTYSARLYELLKQYESIGKRLFRIEELREYLGLEADEYKRINDFTRFIITPAFKELPQKSDLRFEYEFTKTGRKYTHITFCIFSEKRKFEALVLPDNESSQKPTAISLYEATEEIIKPELVSKIMLFGIAEAQAIEYVKKYDEDYILGNLEIVEINSKSQSIDNLGAYTAKALKMDYRKQPTVFEIEDQRKAQQKEEQAAQEERKKQKGAELKTEFDSIHAKNVMDFMKQVENIPELKSNYDNWYKSDTAKTTRMIYTIMLKENHDEKAKIRLYSAYYAFVSQENNEESRFIEYAATQGYQVEKTPEEVWLAWEK